MMERRIAARRVESIWSVALASCVAVIVTLATACGGETSSETGPDRGGTAQDASERPGRGDRPPDAHDLDARAPLPGGDAQVEDVVPDDASSDDDERDDAARDEPCSPGERFCVSPDIAALCNAAGSGRAEEPCVDEHYCVSGVCTPGVCRPFVNRCAVGIERERCAENAQGWEAGAPCLDSEYCLDGACLPSACLPRVMFAVDGSSSMGREWPAVRASVNSVALANPDVAFGLSMFPVGLGCSIGDGVAGPFTSAVDWPHVPISTDGAAEIDLWFSSNDIAGGATPLVATIEWFADNAEFIWGAGRDSAHLIILSEGADTCRCSNSSPDQERCWTTQLSAATQRLHAAGVYVYVIGYRFADAPAALNAIAEHGGTPFTTFISAGNETTLTAAFGDVIQNVKLCD